MGFITLGSAYAADTLRLQNLFRELPARAQERVLRPAMEKASKIVAAAEKSEAPKESGLLGESLGVSTTRTYNAAGGSTKLFIAVGVRRGYRRAVVATKRGGVRRLGRAASDAAEAGGDANMRNPAKYLHLVTKGRKAIVATRRKALYSSVTGQFFGKSVAAAAPNPFIERAFEASAEQAASAVLAAGVTGIEAEAAALGK